MINFYNIARDCGVDHKTIKTYFEILLDMHLWHSIRPYKERSNRKNIQAIHKFYLFVTGISSYLKPFHYTEMRGSDEDQSFEHYILLELMAYKLIREKRGDILYWRTKEGYEVDFTLPNLAIEVKISSSICNQDLKNLLIFSENEKNTSFHFLRVQKKNNEGEGERERNYNLAS